MGTVKIRGHGTFSRFNQEVDLRTPCPLGVLLNSIGLQSDERTGLVAVKGNRIVSMSEAVSDGDEVELFAIMLGG